MTCKYHLRLKLQQLHMPVKCDHFTSSMGFVAAISKAPVFRVELTQINLASSASSAESRHPGLPVMQSVQSADA